MKVLTVNPMNFDDDDGIRFSTSSYIREMRSKGIGAVVILTSDESADDARLYTCISDTEALGNLSSRAQDLFRYEGMSLRDKR